VKNIISYENQWEYDIYRVDGIEIADLKEVSIDGILYKVTKRKVSIPYNDMGHSYTATSNHFFIETEVLGEPMTIDLRNPHFERNFKNKKIIATKFKTSKGR
jgi:hypothetical protein